MKLIASVENADNERNGTKRITATARMAGSSGHPHAHTDNCTKECAPNSMEACVAAKWTNLHPRKHQFHKCKEWREKRLLGFQCQQVRDDQFDFLVREFDGRHAARGRFANAEFLGIV